MLLGQDLLPPSDGGTITQFGGNPPGAALLAGQLGDGVVDAGLRSSYNDRAAAVVHNIGCDLAPHAGAPPDNDDLLSLKVHVRSPLLSPRDDPGSAAGVSVIV